MINDSCQKDADKKRRDVSTHTAGLYGAGAGLGVVGVADWACLSSGVELQGLTPGVLGEMGVVGSTWKEHAGYTHTFPMRQCMLITWHLTLARLKLLGPTPCSSELLLFL